jgi:cytochrome d ubiquinol oxidase subunit II
VNAGGGGQHCIFEQLVRLAIHQPGPFAEYPGTAAITFFSFRLQPNLNTEFELRPWGYVFQLLTVAGLAGMHLYSARRRDLATFLSSCLYLAGMLTSATFGVFPYVLPSNTEPEAGLTISNAAAAPDGLYIGLAWWIPGMLLAVIYSIFVYRHFAGKVSE